MCRVLMVHVSGFYAWHKEPLSQPAQDDERQAELIRQAWGDSGNIYGYRKLPDDLRELGEQVSGNRVALLASRAGILAQIGYKPRPGRYGGKPAVVALNTLDRQCEVDAPDNVWVTTITYIKTHEGWLYLSVVIDLFSRRMVDWAAQPRMTAALALQRLACSGLATHTQDEGDDPFPLSGHCCSIPCRAVDQGEDAVQASVDWLAALRLLWGWFRIRRQGLPRLLRRAQAGHLHAEPVVQAR